MTGAGAAPPEAGTGRTRRQRWLRLGLLVAVGLALNGAGAWLAAQIDLQIFPRHEHVLHAMVLGAAALYVALMVVPFMPGIEVGLALMLALGGRGALLVYLCTVLALAIGFAIGRLVPPRAVQALLAWLRLPRAAALAGRLDALPPARRLDLLQAPSSSRLGTFMLRHRYLAIAILLNLPGNVLVGGGGGIALVSGMSGGLSFGGFVALTALAVAPVPLLFYFSY